jgi:hypothetical protein
MPTFKWPFPKSPNVYYARGVYGKHRFKVGKVGKGYGYHLSDNGYSHESTAPVLP